jgi:hypothetical protein
MDKLNPKYNILKKAGSRMGYRLPEKSIDFINEKIKIGYYVIVENVLNNSIKEYSSIRKASKDLNISYSRLSDYINTNILLKNTFLIYNINSKSYFKNSKTLITVFDCLNNSTINFSSIREVTRYLSMNYNTLISRETITKYTNLNKLYKDRYIISIEK